MIATIILSLTLGVSFIIQTINRWRCTAVTCTRDDDDDDEQTIKEERPTLVVPTRRATIHNMFTDDDKCA